MNSYTTYCPVADSVSAHTNIWDAPKVSSDESTTEIVEELLKHGSVTIGGTEYHVMDLYQYGDEEDLRNLVFMTIRDSNAAKDHATQFITDCAIYYFGESNPDLAIKYYQENHGEY
tara:strand:+ start:37 stop:384 length:348 start_codon:yes stop_codon:yes gene_type:complete